MVSLMATPRKFGRKIIQIHTGEAADFSMCTYHMLDCLSSRPNGMFFSPDVLSKALSLFSVVLLLRTQETKLLWVTVCPGAG